MATSLIGDRDASRRRRGWATLRTRPGHIHDRRQWRDCSSQATETGTRITSRVARSRWVATTLWRNTGRVAYAFNLGGGTIQVIGIDLTSDVSPRLVNNTTSFINTNGFNASFSGAITGTGGQLVKIGSGTLEFNNVNNTIGSFLIAGGNVTQAGSTLTTSEMAVGTGSGNTASYTMSGGTLAFSAGTPPPIVGGAASSFRVGDFGGTGTFTQTGGLVSVVGSLNIGNQGGHGEYDISGGDFTLSGGLYSLGRTTSSSPGGLASTGTLNISGSGTVEVKDGNFIIGDRDASGAQGVGTLNQTGGIFTIDAGAGLFLAGYGNGNTYNLTGGTLQVGGSDLVAQYGTGSYQFNLGGGTIQIIRSDSEHRRECLAVVSGSTSVIDTNGLNATFTGSIIGTGGVITKIGNGTLALSGSNNVGGIVVQTGTVTNGSGTTSTVALYVGYTGPGSNGHLNVTDGVVNVAGSHSNDGFTVGGNAGSIGDATISGGIVNVGNASVYSHLFVGTFGGVGSIEQSGGTVNITGPFEIANRGGNGIYTLSSGTLNVGVFPAAGDSNGLIIGRTRSGDAATSGTLNVTGGVLDLFSNTPLLIGGDGSSSTLGSGIVNQSGNSLVTAQLFIELGVNGNGTYNLESGTLQVGGADGIRQGRGTAAFNLGGSTIQVIGSDLTRAA